MTEKGGQGSAAPTKVARIQSPRGVSVRLEAVAVAVNELLQGTARGLMRLGGVLQENEGIAKGCLAVSGAACLSAMTISLS